MPEKSVRLHFYEYLHESTFYSLDSFVQEQVRARLAERRSAILSDRNVHTYRHGSRWSTDTSLENTSELRSVSAESTIHTSDVINHNITLIENHIRSLADQMNTAFMSHLFQTVADATEANGNTIRASDYHGSFSRSFLAMLDKIEFGVDRYGHPQRPSIYVPPSEGSQLITALTKESEDFHLQIEETSIAKEKGAIAREAERISRFRWKAR